MLNSKLSTKWIDSLHFKAWSIAYEISDPEIQIELIIALVRKYSPNSI